MENIITPEQGIVKKEKNKFYIFLAGPIQGAPLWQFEMPNIEDVMWLSPRRISSDGFNYENQINWETFNLRMADAIIFCIPEQVKNIPGRFYAQTTRTELGEILGRRSSKNIFFYCYKGWPGENYIKHKFRDYGYLHFENSIEELYEDVKEWVKRKKEYQKLWFTSDTHFGSRRALELSKRPFWDVVEMNETMMERWNAVVSPFDVIYHLGDFGDLEWKDYLNGHITILKGNYDTKFDIEGPYLFGNYELVHEPTKRTRDKNVLFGHIHGRQKIKDYGLDVGVDANNFTPISVEDVEFYLNAIKNHYDKEVFDHGNII